MIDAFHSLFNSTSKSCTRLPGAFDSHFNHSFVLFTIQISLLQYNKLNNCLKTFFLNVNICKLSFFRLIIWVRFPYVHRNLIICGTLPICAAAPRLGTTDSSCKNWGFENSFVRFLAFAWNYWWNLKSGDPAAQLFWLSNNLDSIEVVKYKLKNMLHR